MSRFFLSFWRQFQVPNFGGVPPFEKEHLTNLGSMLVFRFVYEENKTVNGQRFTITVGSRPQMVVMYIVKESFLPNFHQDPKND